MLHLLGKGQAPEWNEDKHDVEEVFALLCTIEEFTMQNGLCPPMLPIHYHGRYVFLVSKKS